MSEIADALERLRGRFEARAAEDLTRLQQWSGDGPANPDDVRQLVHRLAGAAGTFGFHRLSQLAADAEDAIVAGEADQQARLADVMRELQQLTAAKSPA